MSMFKRLRVYFAIALCTTPLLFGTPPTPDPCIQRIFTGHIRTSDGQSVSGLPVFIMEIYDGEILDEFSHQDSGFMCRADSPTINAHDTSDTEGAFSISINDEYEIDSVLIIVSNAVDSSSVRHIVDVRDTTSSQTYYSEDLRYSGSGCDCSSSPYTYLSSVIYFYNDRDIILP